MVVHLSGRPASQTLYRINGAYFFPGVSGGSTLNMSGDLVCVPSNGMVRDSQFLTQLGYCVSLGDIQLFLQGFKL